jgi:cell wall-associated NlpC family hydrolase
VLTVASLGATAVPASAAPAATPQPVSVRTVSAPATTTTALTRQQRRAQVAVRFAKNQIGDRYRWGGTGPNSWDCSGLSMMSWRKAGVKLPRTTYSIYRKVRKKVAYRNLRPGDLVFFYSSRSHMGVYVGKGYMVHSPSSGKRVQRVKLKYYYKRHFRGAVRPG